MFPTTNYWTHFQLEVQEFYVSSLKSKFHPEYLYLTLSVHCFWLIYFCMKCAFLLSPSLFFFFCFSTFPLLFLTGSHPAIPYFYIEKEESINCTKFSLVGLFVEGRKGISVDVFCSFFKNDTASEDFHCFYISQHWEDKNDLDVLQSFFFRNYFLCLESDMLGQLESYTIFINSYKNCCKFCISV